MNKSEINYIVISDIHLGHKRNSTKEIIKSLALWFNDYKPRDNLDFIFLAGDVFDRLLDLASDEIQEIIFWVYRLFDFCKKNKIRLRVLEGTPSHDWRQSEIFKTIHQAAYDEVDFKYVDTLYVEVVKDLDFSILYIPDEWHNDTNETFKQAESAVKAEHLVQVDIAVMHGLFSYQLPIQTAKIPRHNENDYLRLVKYFISIGHIHTSSTFQRILAQGSFDRLAHGEEEAKGGMEITITKEGESRYFFIENKNAKIFKTINLKFKDIDRTVKQITKNICNLPNDSYIRLRANKDHPAIIGFEELRKKFPNCVLSKITFEEEKDIQSRNLVDERDTEIFFNVITITKENIFIK